MILKKLILRLKSPKSHFQLNRFSSSNLSDLKDRGLVNDLFPDTSAGEIVDLMKSSQQTVYAGFDPTADSLHIGNLLILIKLLHWQRAGHNVIALLGGATAQIGDPSGRTTERPILLQQQVLRNTSAIKESIMQIFKNHENYFLSDGIPGKLGSLKIVNNLEWYDNMSALDFIGKLGRNFRLSAMLQRESVKTRMVPYKGMTFTEFTYQILQAYDWLHLYKDCNCRFQIGGIDQLGNVVSGHDLILKVENARTYGLFLPLMTSKEGDKYGKSLGNALWLSRNLTTEFDFYQFFMRLKDSEVEKFLLLYSFEPVSKIKELMAEHAKNPGERLAQRKLARKVTLLVHGQKGLNAALKVSSILYDSDIDALKNLKREELTLLFDEKLIADLFLEPGVTISEAAVKAGCYFTQEDAIKGILAGGFYINKQRVHNPNEVINTSSHILPNNITLMRVGKKFYTLVRWST